jgi:hypothetical protein
VLSIISQNTLNSNQSSPGHIMHTLDHAQHTRLRIALYLAQRGLSILPVEALRECGRAAAMTGAEMTANQQGTSHDARGTACLRFVQGLVDRPAPPTAASLQAMHLAGFSESDILEVQAQVHLSMTIATPCEIVNCGQADSRQVLAD